MSEHIAEILWTRHTESFDYKKYDRTHIWRFDNGVEVQAAAAPAFLGDPACVDPEEAFVASVSSCHMLTFLAIASRKRLVVDAYQDSAIGHMEKNAEGRLAILRIVLSPKITFADGVNVDTKILEEMHHLSHKECFIANSIKADVVVKI